MALAWFICPYKRLIDPDMAARYVRYCAMEDFNAAIGADGGAWSYVEVLGNWALCKVRASDATLTSIAGMTGFIRIQNHFLLADTLADLTNAQRNAIQNRLLAMGYTQAEIDTAMGNSLALWRQKTLQTLLALIATRWRKPRYVQASDSIVFDGEIRACQKSVTQLDGEVQ